jgi:pyridoxine 5-phosphate synthase
MIKLGINIDHVATLRQARGTKYPSVVEAALRAEQAGADSITLHLREDRRHMQDEDIFAIRPLLQTKMNLELAATDEMIAIASRVKPQDVCIVPERREERTTEGGLNIKETYDHLYRATQTLGEQGCRVSLFIAPDLKDIDLAKKMGAPVVEIHTGSYADAEDEATKQKES